MKEDEKSDKTVSSVVQPSNIAKSQETMSENEEKVDFFACT